MAITDKFTYVAAGTITSMQAPGKALAAASINIGSATNWPTTSAVFFAIRRVDPTTVTSLNPSGMVPGTYTVWKGTVAGTVISNLQLQLGSDQVYPAGTNTQVFIDNTASQMNSLIDGILAQHTQLGAHTAITATSLAVSGTSSFTGAVTLPNNSVKYTNLAAGISRLGFGTSTGATLTTAYVTYPSVTATTHGGAIELQWSAQVGNGNSGASKTFDIQILCDGVVTGITPATLNFYSPYITPDTTTLSYGFIHNQTAPTAASHTWTLQFKASANTAVVLGNSYLKVTEIA